MRAFEFITGSVIYNSLYLQIPFAENHLCHKQVMSTFDLSLAQKEVTIFSSHFFKVYFAT